MELKKAKKNKKCAAALIELAIPLEKFFIAMD
jgi:hypothetical protein